MLSNLLSHINRYIQLSEKDIQLLQSTLMTQKLIKKEQIHQAGKKCNARYFVNKGCLRSYFLNDKGVEQILQFAIENWWISDYQSLTQNTESDLYIEAIEDSEVVIVSKEDENVIFEQIPQLERYFRLVLERERTAALTRIRYMYEFSKEGEYKHFFKGFPSFFERVPDYMIASYLGLTPEYLSRIRKNFTS